MENTPDIREEGLRAWTRFQEQRRSEKNSPHLLYGKLQADGRDLSMIERMVRSWVVDEPEVKRVTATCLVGQYRVGVEMSDSSAQTRTRVERSLYEALNLAGLPEASIAIFTEGETSVEFTYRPNWHELYRQVA